jgi:hypothetical protein
MSIDIILQQQVKASTSFLPIDTVQITAFKVRAEHQGEVGGSGLGYIVKGDELIVSHAVGNVSDED